MGRLLAIACAPAKRAPMIERPEAPVSVAQGLAGDVRGPRARRQVTVLFRDGWEAACAELGVALPWVVRRANLYIEGVPPPPAGGRLTIGAVVLEVTGETKPCRVMEAAHPGLRRAMAPDWRGGVTCSVIAGGILRAGDRVDVLR
jgi:MOSC domain-containing protein YiiM